MAGLQYKCPGCGAPIDFDISKGALTCDYCGQTFSVRQVEEYNQAHQGQVSNANDAPHEVAESSTEQAAPAPAQAGAAEPEQPTSQTWNDPTSKDVWDPAKDAGLVAFTCGSCGGEILASPDTISTRCPYCDNNFVSRSQLETTLKPQKIIPFVLTRENVLKTMKHSTRGKWFLPRKFRPENAIKDIVPMYLPFWLYDANVHGAVEYEAHDYERWSDSDWDYTRTSTYRVQRIGKAYFQDIPFYAADAVPERHTEAVEPFDYRAVQPFVPAYLAGVATNKYTIGPEVGNKRAFLRMENSLASSMAESVTGYDSVSVAKVNMALGDNNVEYAFLPLWMLNLQYKGKVYTFAMNGQTGKFAGDFPVSKGKMWSTLLVLWAALAALISVGSYFIFLA